MDELELQKAYQNGEKENAARPSSDLKLKEQATNAGEGFM